MNVPVPDAIVPSGEWGPRQLIVGVEAGGRSKAYAIEALREQSPILDALGDVPIVLVIAADGRSIRAFDRRLDGEVLELYARPDVDPPLLVDASGTEWSFAGAGLNGPHAGRQLEPILPLKDYWFDWKNFHPDTFVYTGGER
jgi:hypothetical protein